MFFLPEALINVGCISCIVISIVALVLAFIYKKHRTLKGALVSICVATVIQIVVSSFVTKAGYVTFG